eukprot:8317370-Pyramimonas_sp.AAC.1
MLERGTRWLPMPRNTLVRSRSTPDPHPRRIRNDRFPPRVFTSSLDAIRYINGRFQKFSSSSSPTKHKETRRSLSINERARGVFRVCGVMTVSRLQAPQGV